jgi:AraC-like DNA-binding protein
MISDPIPPIRYTCYSRKTRDGEQFAPTHTIVLVTAGAMEITDTKQTLKFDTNELCFCSKNSLIKYVKYPTEASEFRSISIHIPQQILLDFARAYGYAAQHVESTTNFQKLQSGSLLLNYMKALLPYQEIFKQENSKELLVMKVKEAILTLLMENPELQRVLFDFSEPGKIDLESFMMQNYHFNVELKRFAYLTGRSLSTFKRDFERIFKMPPSRWLLQRRLDQAYYLIKKKRKPASKIYLELGFEDLSHFSYAFKKQFGVSPSLL